jgi:hypothetical protein
MTFLQVISLFKINAFITIIVRKIAHPILQKYYGYHD